MSAAGEGSTEPNHNFRHGRKCKSSPVTGTILSVHNGFDRFGHSIFFFSNFTGRNGICMYKFPACYGIGQQRTVHFKHNQLTVE